MSSRFSETTLPAGVPLPSDGIAPCGEQPSRLQALHSKHPAYGTWAYKRRLERAYVDWLHERGLFTHFVTLTFKLIDIAGRRTTQKMVEDAVRNLLRRLACTIHGRRRIKYRPPIRSVVTIDWGWKGNHPHAHLMLEGPAGMGYEQFSALIKRCAHRVNLLDGEPHIRPYQDAGGARYVVKHGIGRMIVSLFDAPYYAP